MGNRLYFLEELPETYGRLQGFCTDLFLGQMQQKAQELQLFRQAIIYGELRAAFRQSQRRKDRWPIKVAQFNETLAACINMGRRITEEAHLQLEYKKKIEEDGSYTVGQKLWSGPGPKELGLQTSQNDTSSTHNNWAS
nr:V3 protein [Trifolium virus 1]QVS02745.1 V3 [Trifolium virus 1]QVS02751.1 V3 [Trifolium virus 1]QVS02757.1 V3 [Trifolium virus 1]QVS02763.1 V3 [Trifolium virus 1]